MLGVQGPNVGYAYTLAHRAVSSLELGARERPDDVTAVLAEIAGRRAALSGRAQVLDDVGVESVFLG
jgi:hypothetical protein